MILRYFRLREQPFGVTPDPRYLYASDTHREALASLQYGCDSGLGFIILTAKPGMGKTTLLFEVLRNMQDTKRTVFLFQSISTPNDLLRAVLIDLGVKNIPVSIVDQQALLNQILVSECSAGKSLVVIIDEAQNLNESVLETLRMFSNFETSRQKMMQIILSGQPQLNDKLALPQMLQLRQRISILAHLKPLSEKETIAYIEHRLQVSGRNSNEPLFSKSALSLIAHHGKGIPRNINNICFNALSLGCALQRRVIDSDVINEVVADLSLERHELNRDTPKHATRKPARVATSKILIHAAVLAACVTVGVIGWLTFYPSLKNIINSKNKPSDPVSDVQTRLVLVQKGQSIYKLCQQYLGECDVEVLRNIVNLNPDIHDPDHIRYGQKILIPMNLSILNNKKSVGSEQ